MVEGGVFLEEEEDLEGHRVCSDPELVVGMMGQYLEGIQLSGTQASWTFGQLVFGCKRLALEGA